MLLIIINNLHIFNLSQFCKIKKNRGNSTIAAPQPKFILSPLGFNVETGRGGLNPINLLKFEIPIMYVMGQREKNFYLPNPAWVRGTKFLSAQPGMGQHPGITSGGHFSVCDLAH